MREKVRIFLQEQEIKRQDRGSREGRSVKITRAGRFI